MLDLLAFPDNARVWIYAAATPIDENRIQECLDDITEFVRNWQSHQVDLVATGGILHHQFIILVVDEQRNLPGGCSIDQSVRFIQSMNIKYKVDFLQRIIFQYIDGESVKNIAMHKLKEAYNTGEIGDDTLFFDHLVQRKDQFISSWLKPLKNSWHYRLI